MFLEVKRSYESGGLTPLEVTSEAHLRIPLLTNRTGIGHEGLSPRMPLDYRLTCHDRRMFLLVGMPQREDAEHPERHVNQRSRNACQIESSQVEGIEKDRDRIALDREKQLRSVTNPRIYSDEKDLLSSRPRCC